MARYFSPPWIEQVYSLRDPRLVPAHADVATDQAVVVVAHQARALGLGTTKDSPVSCQHRLGQAGGSRCHQERIHK